jgi:hypothetical protein
MTLGFRGTLAMLALPFAAYAVASVVAAYRPIVGANIAKGDALPPAEDYSKGRDRTIRIAGGAQRVGQLAFTGAAEEQADTLPDDMRKLARGITERNQVWENVRLFLGDAKAAKFKGSTAKAFEAAK